MDSIQKANTDTRWPGAGGGAGGGLAINININAGCAVGMSFFLNYLTKCLN